MSELELELRALDIEWPETPDLAAAVQERITVRRRSWLSRPAWQLAVACVALLIAVVMAIPPARAAVLEFLGFSSVRITREEPQPSRFGQALALGDPVTLARAERALPVVVPDAVGRPDAVYLYEHPTMGPRVDMVYRARPGLPASSNTGAGLLVTEFEAVASPVIEKAIGSGAEVDQFTLDGDPAVFISGREHGFAYIPPDGNTQFEGQRLAGNTLLVDRSDGVLLRLEGELDRDEAVRIARSVD